MPTSGLTKKGLVYGDLSQVIHRTLKLNCLLLMVKEKGQEKTQRGLTEETSRLQFLFDIFLFDLVQGTCIMLMPPAAHL